MIIKYPTGLYNNAIPSGTESGNITFTISNNPPPRSNLLFPKISNGIARRQIARSDEALWRRETVGDLIFNVSESKRTLEGSNNKVFETGQILEFNDSIPKTVDQMLVGDTVTTQHNINRINYEPLGINEGDQQLINSVSMSAYKSLENELNEARQRRKNAEQSVVENQKIINNSTKTIEALKIVQDETSGTDSDVYELILKLETKRNAAFEARDAAIAVANESAIQSASLVDRLRTISTVLK